MPVVTPEQLPGLSWRAEVLPLPRSFHGARSAGLFDGQPAGSAESAGNRWVGVLWRDGQPIKQEDTPKTSIEFLAARGGLIAGKRRVGPGQSHALAVRSGKSGVETLDLHPMDFEESAAVACDGMRLAGQGVKDGVRRGLLWESADSPPSELRDPSGEPARASALDGILVVGAAGWPSRALIWPDGATLARMLPAPELEWTQPLGAGEGRIVGYASKTEAAWAAGYTAPVLWPGPDETPVRLLPEGFIAGQALDCRAGLQAGYVRQGDVKHGFDRAVLWCGTPFRYADLHATLGDPWTDSLARSIHVIDSRLVVLGEAWQLSTDRLGIVARQVVQWETSL